MHRFTYRLIAILTLALLNVTQAQTLDILDHIIEQQNAIGEFLLYSYDVTETLEAKPNGVITFDMLDASVQARAPEFATWFDELNSEYRKLLPAVQEQAANSHEGMMLFGAIAAGSSAISVAYDYLNVLIQPEGLTYEQHRTLTDDISQWLELQRVWMMLHTTR